MKHRFTLLLLLLAASAFAQTDGKLTAKLNDAVKDFHGQVGIYVHNLKTGKTVEINADTLFPPTLIPILFVDMTNTLYVFCIF